MTSNFRDLRLLLYQAEADYLGTPTNLTADVIDLPLFTDTGSGEVNELRVVLKAPYGKYISNGTVIAKYDRIWLRVNDLNAASYSRFFEIDDIELSESKGDGTILTLQCLGLEYHTQNIHFAKAFWFARPDEVAEMVGDAYNMNRKPRQPELVGHDSVDYDISTRRGNGLPGHTVSHFEYGHTPTPCYTIWQDIVDRQGAPVRDGGVFDFFELGFDTPNVNRIALRILSSGIGPATPKVIKKTLRVNPSESEGVISNPTATRVGVIGDARAGSLPTGRAEYISHIYEFLYRNVWASTLTYEAGSKVQLNGKHYRSLQNNNTNRNPESNTTWWQRIDFSDEVGDAVQYSPWTDDKVGTWVNSGSNPSAVTAITGGYQSTGAGCFDGNIVINDSDFFATWVDQKADDTTPLSTVYDYPGNGLRRGYRFLNIGTGVVSQMMLDGVSTRNSIIEYVDTGGNLGGVRPVVKYHFDNTLDRAQVAVLDEGKVYEWRADTETFVDISANDLGNHCFHRWSTMKNVEGFDWRPHTTDSTRYPEITKDGSRFATNQNSAIEAVYEYAYAAKDRLLGERERYQSKGAWLNLRFPIPVSTYNSVGNVGSIYGTGARYGTVQINEPATLDISNMSYTPSGKIGFNQDDSDALMTLTSFSFALSVHREFIVNNAPGSPRHTPVGQINYQPSRGRIHLRCLMGDTQDNVWYYDFIMPERTDGPAGVPRWHHFDLPLSQFEIYRGRKPRYVDTILGSVGDLVDLINPKELGVPNIFEQRNIAWIVIQVQDSYDEFGRFAPDQGYDFFNTDVQDTSSGRMTIRIDDVHFRKPLLVFSGTDDDRNIESVFLQREDIILTTQAREVAASQLQIEQFQHKEFDLTTTGSDIFDIRFGDSFFFEDERMVNETEMGTTPHTIKLVAKRIEYSISRPIAGRGGLQRRIKGIKRFT